MNRVPGGHVCGGREGMFGLVLVGLLGKIYSFDREQKVESSPMKPNDIDRHADKRE